MQRLRLLLSHNSIPPMLVALCLGVLTLVISAPWWVYLFIPFGIIAQMINEYALHRFVFHLPAPKQQWAFDLIYRAHYGHHDFPTNTRLFFAPIWVSLPILCVNFFGLWGILGLLGVAMAAQIAAAVVLVGGVLTFLAYEWFHMTAHLNLKKTKVERYVTQLHNQHHFRDFSKWFHVSPGGEIIDRALGTSINREDLRAQQRIEFIRTLGLRPDDPRFVSARHRFAEKYGLRPGEIEQAARS